MKHSSTRRVHRLVGIGGFLALIGVWSLFARDANELILPSPTDVIRALVHLAQTGELLTNFVITLRRALIGFSLGFSAGLAVALAMAKSEVIRVFLQPVVTVMQTIPPVIWLIIAVIWFGIAQEITPIFIIFVIVFPIVLVGILEGLQGSSSELKDMGRSFRASHWRLFVHVILPALSPSIVASVRVGLAFAWKSTVLAEFLGSSSGVGFMLSVSNNLLNTAQVFAWAIVLVAVMLAIEYIGINPLRGWINRWLRYAQH